MITVFTPTYNRAHTLEKLYQSLLKQDSYDFEWLVINDGSTDDTDTLFQEWIKQKKPFPIHYYEVENGGKQRAINQAIQLAKGEYFFIVDSDDTLLPHAISFLINSFVSLPNDDSFIGVSGIRGDKEGKPLFRIPNIDNSKGYVDANNIERSLYGLQADMAEAFFTNKIKDYTFPVWPDEKFTPEAVVWDQMALDGYKLRWFNEVIYLCEYQEDGLTKSSWRLLKQNPMGYAMLFNTQLKHQYSFRVRINLCLQFIACCCLAKEYSYIPHCNAKGLAYLLFPMGWLLSKRRKQQFKQFCS